MKEIRFNLYSFIKFNPQDQFGLFRSELVLFRSRSLLLNPTEVPDFHEESLRLTKQLFLKYDYLILTQENRLFGVDGKKRHLIKDNLHQWFEAAIEFKKSE